MPVVFDATATGQVAFASTVSFSHTCSAAADRILFVGVVCNNNVSISSVTYNGVAMTPVESGNAFQRLYVLLAPTSGANTVLVTLSGAEAAIARSVSYTGAAQSLPTGVQASATGDAAPSVTVSSAASALVVGMSSYIDLGGQAAQTAGAGQTSRGSGEQSGHYLILSDEPGATSVVHSYGRSGGFYYHQRVIGVSVAEGAPSAPVITAQPAAQTVVRNDPARAARAMAVAATTSGAGVSVQWYRGASGVTTNPISAGGVYAISTTGTTSLSTTLTITPTDNSLSGESFWCRVTDSLGSTDSAAAVLTVRTGVALSKTSGVTNASGVDTLTATSDLAQAAGEVIVFVATDGGVVKRTTGRYA